MSYRGSAKVGDLAPDLEILLGLHSGKSTLPIADRFSYAKDKYKKATAETRKAKENRKTMSVTTRVTMTLTTRRGKRRRKKRLPPHGR